MGELHKLLLQEFGVGLSFTASGASLAVKIRKIEPFFQKAKEIDCRIINIFTDTFTPSNQPAHFPNGISFVDHFVDRKTDNLTAATIVKIVSPTIDDLNEPSEAWDKFDRRLNTLFDIALKQAKQSKPDVTEDIKVHALSAETILKMDAPQLIAAWNAVAKSAKIVPDVAVHLVDPAHWLVSRMHTIGLAHIQNGEKISSATLEDFKLATNFAIQFLEQQSASSKVAQHIQRLVADILPKLESG